MDGKRKPNRRQHHAARLGTSGTTGAVTGLDLGSRNAVFDSPVPDLLGRTLLVCGDPRHGSRDGFNSHAIHHAWQAQMAERSVEAREAVRSTRTPGTHGEFG